MTAILLSIGAWSSVAQETSSSVARAGRVRAPDGRWLPLARLGLEDASATAGAGGGFWVSGRARSLRREELLLVRVPDVGSEPRRLPPLPVGEPLAREPLPLIDAHGDLVGAAWLEGSDGRRLGVRFSAWTGEVWSPTEPVAPPGPGSQLALTGTVTADGAVLLAWSGFDGTDDEILWSRRGRGGWSEPVRLGGDNAVPDITPALSREGRGARIAWSRFLDGRYRVVSSRFDGRVWSEPERFGPPGSLFPSFEPGAPGGGRWLLFRTAEPRGWQAIEIDRAGRPRRVAGIAAESSERPRLSADDPVLRFVWTDPGSTVGAGLSMQAPWENLP